MDIDVQKVLEVLEEQNKCDAGLVRTESDNPTGLEGSEYPTGIVGEPQQYPEQVEIKPINPDDDKTEPIGPDNDGQPEPTVSEEKVEIELDKD